MVPCRVAIGAASSFAAKTESGTNMRKLPPPFALDPGWGPEHRGRDGKIAETISGLQIAGLPGPA
jgi:hypothetical protein